MDFSPPDSSVREILQARILEWVASRSSGDLPDSETEQCLLRWQEDSVPLSHQEAHRTGYFKMFTFDLVIHYWFSVALCFPGIYI